MIHYITTNGIGNAWVAAELGILHALGLPCVLHSMRVPHQHFFESHWAEAIERETRYIYPLRPISFGVSLLAAPFLFRGRFFRAVLNALLSQRESLRARFACMAHLAVACDWARKLRREPVTLIHSQWIQSGGTIGWYAARLLRCPFSFTGHAVDLFRARVALRDKVRDASFIVAISGFHRDLYVKLGADPSKILLVYCGIDVAAYAYGWRPWGRAPRILSFGRLVEKKGFDTLIGACMLLRDRGVVFECEIAGSGPDEAALRQQVQSCGLSDSVVLTGKALMQEEICDWLGRGHIYAQPCCWSKDNDVDGIPRSLMEAMAVGLPSVSTAVAGIPDLVQDNATGLLVKPRDAAGLADALERLIRDQDLAQRLSLQGRKHIESQFEIRACVQRLASEFFRYLDPSRSPVSGHGRVQ